MALLLHARLRGAACAGALVLAAGIAGPLGADEAHAALAETAKGPVGYDSFRRLDLLPLLRPGVQARQESSYDRSGANDDGIPGTYSCRRITAQGRCVLAEHAGPGEIDSMWFTRHRANIAPTGGLRIVLDGRTVVDAPLLDVVNGRLGAPFVLPLVANTFQSSGGAYVKVPMPFRERMEVSTSANPIYYHVAFRTFSDADGVTIFDPAAPAADVLATLRASGLRDPKPALPGARTAARAFTLAPGRRLVLDRRTGPGVITALQLRFRRLSAPRRGVPFPRQELFRFARVQMFFDGRRTVDAPLGEFFGSGIAPATVRALLLAQSPSPFGWLSAWWPMPFTEGAALHLVNTSRTSVFAGDLRVTGAPSAQWGEALRSGEAGRFRTTSRRGFTTPGVDWPILVTGGRGLVVGVSQSLRGTVTRRYLEGDERVSADGAPVSLYHGTGTEDFYEGGFYFLRGPFTRPLNGAPARRFGGFSCPLSDCTSMYRLLVGDAIPFARSLRFTMEHGPANALRGLYGSTAYWYG